MPAQKIRSLAQRRAMSSTSSKSRAWASSRSSCSASDGAAGQPSKKPGDSTASSRLGLRRSSSARRGALPMISATRFEQGGVAVEQREELDARRQPWPRNSSNRSAGLVGLRRSSPAPAAAPASARSEARAPACCRGRPVAAVVPARAPMPRRCRGSPKPMFRRVSSVSGSSSVPVKTRLPRGAGQRSAPPRTGRRSGLPRGAWSPAGPSGTAPARHSPGRWRCAAIAGLVGRQAVGLAVVDHLQAVLDLAEEAVGLDQLVRAPRLDRGRQRPAPAGSRTCRRCAASGSRPPKISCWVWAKNSISRMPPRPSLTLWPLHRDGACRRDGR